MRIVILGNSGSGKSTLASRLSRRLGVPVLDLDTVAWEPGKIAVPRSPEDAVADVNAFAAAHDGWIVEGCYAALARAALGHAPVLLFLEPGVEACVAHCKSRPFEPHKYATKQEQDERLGLLLDWVASYPTRTDDMSLAAHQAAFDSYAGPKEKLTAVPPESYSPAMTPL